MKNLIISDRKEISLETKESLRKMKVDAEVVTHESILNFRGKKYKLLYSKFGEVLSSELIAGAVISTDIIFFNGLPESYGSELYIDLILKHEIGHLIRGAIPLEEIEITKLEDLAFLYINEEEKVNIEVGAEALTKTMERHLLEQKEIDDTIPFSYLLGGLMAVIGRAKNVDETIVSLLKEREDTRTLTLPTVVENIKYRREVLSTY